MPAASVFDVCVVGAGLVGSAAARHAAELGYHVCLLGPAEPARREDWPSREVFSCHYDEGRITRVWDPSEDLRILNQESMNRYSELQDKSGIQFHSPVGCLFFGENGSEMVEQLKKEKQTSKLNENILDVSDRHVFNEKFEYLRCSPDESGFLEMGGSGHVSPRRLVEAQQLVAVKHGCVIVREVAETVARPGLMQVITSTGKKVSSQRVLLCTNTYTLLKPGLLPTKDGRKPDLWVQKITAALLRISLEEAKRLQWMPSLVYRRNTGEPAQFYALPPIQYPDGNWYLKIGIEGSDARTPDVTLSEIKAWYIAKGDEIEAKAGEEVMKVQLPGLKVEGRDRIGCATCMTPTGRPYIDLLDPDFGVAIGGNGVCAKNSDEIGRIAVTLLLRQEWTSSADREKFAIRWTDV